MSKPNILFIIPSLDGGGAERVLINLLNNFDYNRYNVELCVVIKRGIYFNEIPSNVKTTVLFYSEILAKIMNKLHVKFNFNWVYRKIVKKKLLGQYNIGISFLDSSFTDILFFLKNDQIHRTISWVHSSYDTNTNFLRFYKGNYKKRIIDNRYKKLDHIVFVSHDAMLGFQNIFGCPTQMSVIYNFVDTKSVLNKSKDSLNVFIDKNKINIIALGSLYPIKGYENLIIAAKLLKEEKLNFLIRILGTGPLKNDLLKLIDHYDVRDTIQLEGYKSNPYPYLKASDIFVMTSLSEALPTALCEAMVLGLPTIVTNCSGCREIVGYGKYGMMVECNPTGIFDGLKRMIILKDIRSYYSNRSIERAKLFDDDIVLEKACKIFDHC